MYPTSRLRALFPAPYFEPHPKLIESVPVPSEPIVEIITEPDDLPPGSTGQLLVTFYGESQAAPAAWDFANLFDHFDCCKTTHEMGKSMLILGGIK